MTFASLLPISPAPAVTLIDGHSGSGKTMLAQRLADSTWRETGVYPQIIGMDELYPGWGGLAAGSASLPGVLRSATYRRYDWGRDAFGDEIAIAPGLPLIVEGCGSLTAESLAAARELGATRAVWIECPEPLRRERALARDGEMFIPHWENWAAQERVHFSAAQPRALAHETVHQTVFAS